MKTNDLAPIVLFVYNRPRHTLLTLQALKNNILANESILYIFSDGFKNNSDTTEKNLVLETRNIIKSEKWCQEVIIKESTENKGLANSIIDGITEIINKYGKIIVLEDDIVTSPSFLQYMNDALNFYENEKKIWHIAGYANKFYENFDTETFFTKYMSCWGWATWADRWKYFDKNPKYILSKIGFKDKRKFTYNNKYKTLWQIKANISGKRNTWAVFWYSTIYLNDGLCLNSKTSFVKNIGQDGSGVHCGNNSFIDIDLCEKYPIKFETNLIETKNTRTVFEKKYSNSNKKLILLKPYGQHSNRLIQNLHFDAFCKPVFYKNNELYNNITKIKQKGILLIGVHIRRGDYKKWLGGKYYFGDEVYENYMNDLSQKLLKENGKKQMFIIFSNDFVNFSDMENLIISNENWYIDHHILSLCDYIIGTRSTFTLWASYMGKNTFFCIRDNSGKIENTVSDFIESDLSHILGEEEAKNQCKNQKPALFNN